MELRYSNKVIIYNTLMLVALSFMFFSGLTSRLQWHGFEWHAFLILAAAPLLQLYVLIHSIFWRLWLDKDEMESVRLILPNKTINIREITHFTEKERFSSRFVSIYAGKKLFVQLSSSCHNFDALMRKLSAMDDIKHFDITNAYGKEKYRLWKKENFHHV